MEFRLDYRSLTITAHGRNRRRSTVLPPPRSYIVVSGVDLETMLGLTKIPFRRQIE